MQMDPFVSEVYNHDRARFISLLFMDSAKRADIAPLYALSLELARIPMLVSEPMPGEIRLQWWRDVFNGERKQEAGQSPLASEVLRLMNKYHLPVDPLIRLLDARSFDLYADPIETIKQLEGYAGDTVSSLMQLTAIILNDGQQTSTAQIAGYGGVALTIANILIAAPYTLSRGQTYLPMELLKKHGVAPEVLHAGLAPAGAKDTVNELCAIGLDYLARARAEPPAGQSLAAFLELSIVEPTLNRLAKQGSRALKTPTELPNWRKQFYIWRAARRGVF